MQNSADLQIAFTVLQMVNLNQSKKIDEEERKLCAAKIRMEQDLPHYSDANFTMRLSYGQVKRLPHRQPRDQLLY